MSRQPLELTPEQYKLLAGIYNRHGFRPALQEALSLGAALQLEEICDWLEDINGPTLVGMLRREFQVSDFSPAGEDEVVTTLQVVADHLEASAHNCQRAGEGIQVLLKEIRRKRDA